jgi:hypothetical protein
VDVYYQLRQTKLLPALGSLQTYLVVADFAVAGRVTMPTLDEMGELIFTIGRGSKKGLELLGFSVGTIRESQYAFKCVYECLENWFSVEAKAQMPLNTIAVENFLCKLRRINVRPFRDFLLATKIHTDELRFLEQCKGKD